jgi:hypothetical protein
MEETNMDFGSFQLGLIEIVGVLLLLAVLLWGVLRVKSGGRKDSPAVTEQATRDLYRKEEKRHDEGTEEL